jgi:alcohol dehydrogenase class IV
MAHALSTVADLHHGLANGIAIPYTMAFNQPAVAARLGDLAVAVGAGSDGPAFLRWLVDLKKSIGIPATLSEAGVDPKAVDRLVDVAVHDACHPNNPRAVTEPDFRRLFDRAFSGEVVS